MYRVTLNYSVYDDVGGISRDTYYWVGDASSGMDAFERVKRDLALAYSGALQVVLETVNIEEVEPCTACGGTGYSYTVFGESSLCQNCNGKRVVTVLSFHAESGT